MINLYKGVEIDSSYNITYDVSSDASFLSYLSKYLKQSLDDNFNFMWLTSTTATITIDNGSLDIAECLNFNYLCYEENYKYFYFFITRSECNSNQSTTFTLSLDVWSTYGYRELILTNPTLYIDRAHCSRFTTKDTINYTLPQMLTPESGTQQRNVVDNVTAFNSSYLVVQVVPRGIVGDTAWLKTTTATGVAMPITIIAPYDSGYTGTADDGTSGTIKASELYDIVKQGIVAIMFTIGGVDAHYDFDVVSVTVATIPFLTTKTIPQSFSNSYVQGNVIRLKYLSGETLSTTMAYGFYVTTFYSMYEATSINLSYCALKVVKYPSSPTALSLWDKQVEPKLLSYPFTSFNFVDYHKQYSDYNIFKIFAGSNVQTIYHYNMIGNGSSQDMMCFSNTNKYYGFNKMYGIGEVTNYGDSLGWGTDSYSEWCKNNSNTAKTNAMLGIVSGAVGVVGGALLMPTNPVVGAAGVVGGITSTVGGIAKIEANKSDAQSGRDSLSQPSSNISFSQLFNLNLPHGYQIKTIGEEDRNLVSSYFYYNGYAYNSTAKFSDAIGTRCMFNYLKSSDALIKSCITESEDVKQKILEILSKGTEIWKLSFLTGNSKTIAESRGIYANYENDII